MKTFRYSKEAVLVAAVFLIVLGVQALFLPSKDRFVPKKRSIILGLYGVLMGLAIILSAIIWGYEVADIVCFILGGCFLMGYALFLYSKNEKYTEKVKAVFKGGKATYIRSIRGKGIHGFYPIFYYEYNKIGYECIADQFMSEKEISERFGKNKKYDIYIRLDDPKLCIVDKERDSIYLLLFILGIACFAIPILKIIN